TGRALSPSALAEVAGEVFGPDRVRKAATMTEAIEVAVQLADEAGPGAGVLIAGSVYAAGEARSLLVKHSAVEDSDS
ncbi:MAG: dihydrofolate synthase, partial [Propionicimonas sp.]